MLVLSRKQDEVICIHDQIRVTVLRIQGNRVRLGVEAPRGVIIRRSELPNEGRPIPSETPEPAGAQA